MTADFGLSTTVSKSASCPEIQLVAVLLKSVHGSVVRSMQPFSHMKSGGAKLLFGGLVSMLSGW